MRRHRQDLQPMTEMNVTNLLDTAFILLMAFMIVAPAMKHGLELELPEVTASNIDSKKTLTVVILPPALEGGESRYFIEDRRLTLDELQGEIRRQKRIYPDLDVMIEGDANVPYGSFAKALAAIQRAGISNIGLMTDPEPTSEK